MKKIVLFLLFIIATAGCKQKGYEYQEMVMYESATGTIKVGEREPNIIPIENNDTLAWKIAYQYYCVSWKVFRYYHLGKRDTIFFTLISPDYRDITDIEFATQEQLKREIEEEIFLNK